MDLAIPSTWGIGLVLAMTRVGAFVIASPVLNKSVPMPGRLAFVVSVGLFLTRPVPGVSTLAELVGVAVSNAAIGLVLGFLTGMLFHLFAVAGNLIDISANLSVAAVFDPTQGSQSAVAGRLFNLVGLTLFVTVGGIGALVAGLAASTRVLPLAGPVQVSTGALAETATDLVTRLMITGAELAFPVLAMMFLTELVLGVASRLAPQANIFVLGLPVKLLVALSTLSLSLILFPASVEGYVRFVETAANSALRGLGAGG